MAVIHIPEEEAVRDFGSVLKRFYAGEEVVIDGSTRSLRLTSNRLSHAKTGAEILALLAERPEAVPDEEFAVDVAEFRKRHPESLDASRWD